MAHTFSSLHCHIVFSTKHRHHLIPQDNIEPLQAYIAGIARNRDIQFTLVGGTTNHVHILASFPPDLSVAKAVNIIKSNSSKWVHETFTTMGDFKWQEGYAAFAVSKSNARAVEAYIRDQPARHRTMSFDDEIFALLDKHGIDYDRSRVLD